MRVCTFDPVAELPPLGGVDVQSVQLGDGEPADVAGLVVHRGLPGDGAAEQDDLEFLAGLAVGVLWSRRWSAAGPLYLVQGTRWSS